MVAAFGLGAGWAALDKAIPYSVDRIQGGTPLSEKQGYTHKLIVPHLVRLETARAYIEETAERLDTEEGLRNTEGAIAKYLATEAGNAAAEAAIQALGGYGYTKEYMVEKIKRDVRITTIYEGTSEIMEMTIARDRWQEHLKSRGAYYRDRAAALERLAGPETGGETAALALRALAEVLEQCRIQRLTRNQHVLFRLGEMIAVCEGAESLVRRAARAAAGELPAKTDRRFDASQLAPISRVFCPRGCPAGGRGGDPVGARRGRRDNRRGRLAAAVGLKAIRQSQRGLIDDMDEIADVIYERKDLRMGDAVHRAVAIVEIGAVMPDAADAETFWQNIRDGRYSISHVPADRWNADAYYDADPKATDKTYSTLGGWVRELEWDPLGWRLPIPPKVSDAMDRTQIYSIVAARQALLDSGYPDNGVDADRTAVILGNAMSGDLHYLTSLRIFFPEYAAELEHAPSFTALPADVQAAILDEFRAGVGTAHSRTSPKTRCRASWPTSPPAGSPTSTTSTGPTS